MTGKASWNIGLSSFLIWRPKCQTIKLDSAMATHTLDSGWLKHNSDMPIYVANNLEILVGKIKTKAGGQGEGNHSKGTLCFTPHTDQRRDRINLVRPRGGTVIYMILTKEIHLSVREYGQDSHSCIPSRSESRDYSTLKQLDYVKIKKPSQKCINIMEFTCTLFFFFRFHT